MGSPLGPTFAVFYMSNLKTKLLNENKAFNPLFYRRYVDDIIAIVENKSHLNWFKICLHRNSVLKFTHAVPSNNQLQDHGNLSTAVCIKPTDKGIYSSFQSCSPLNYKKSVVKTLVNRALKYSSDWPSFHSEIRRIKQLLPTVTIPKP
jgi:hypothetical protein